MALQERPQAWSSTVNRNRHLATPHHGPSGCICHCATLICPVRRRSRAEWFPRRARAPCASGRGKVSTICRGMHLVVRFPFTYAVAAAQRALSTAIQNLTGGKHVSFTEITGGYTSPPIFRMLNVTAYNRISGRQREKSMRRGYHIPARLKNPRDEAITSGGRPEL